MARFWTCHWRFCFWRDDINSEFEPVCSSGASTFHKRGVSVGDTVYVISLFAGQLYLGGRMTVKRIVSRDAAVQLWGNDNLYEASLWVVDPDQSGTPLNLHRRLAPVLTKRLLFKRKPGLRGLCFDSETELNGQATRGVSELTPESAALLDRIIAVTDPLPRSGEILTVTEELLATGQPAISAGGP